MPFKKKTENVFQNIEKALVIRLSYVTSYDLYTQILRFQVLSPLSPLIKVLNSFYVDRLMSEILLFPLATSNTAFGLL